MGDFFRLGGAADPRMKLRALKASVFLSALFLVVYGGCSWITSQRSGIGTLYFAWERFIPFVPFFILPYMTIDLLFVAAPFLCADEAELRALSRRVALAILVAGACFLIFPLQLAVDRPEAAGWLGAVFRQFCAFDRPYNLLPSLHITLCTILGVHYARHSSGAMPWLPPACSWPRPASWPVISCPPWSACLRPWWPPRAWSFRRPCAPAPRRW